MTGQSGREPALPDPSRDPQLGGEAALLHLVEQARSDDPDVRQRAVFALAAAGDDRVVEGLGALLHDHDGTPPHIRSRAVRALAPMGGQQALQLVVEAVIHDPDWGVRRTAQLAAAHLDPQRAGDLLIAYLDTPPVHNGHRAIAAIQHLPTPRAITWLIEAGQDPVRMAIYADSLIGALGRTGDPRAVPVLLEALTNPRLRPYEPVIHALARTGDPRAVNALFTMLTSTETDSRRAAAWAIIDVVPRWHAARLEAHLIRLLADDSSRTRSAAARGLAAVGGRLSVEPLAACLVGEVDWWVRLNVARALESLRVEGHPITDPVLAALGADPLHTADALVEIRLPEAVPTLLGLLADPEVGQNAARALGHQRDARAIPALVRRARGEGRAAVAAVRALGRLGVAAPGLRARLDDGDSLMRHAAVFALAVLGVRSAAPDLRARLAHLLGATAAEGIHDSPGEYLQRQLADSLGMLGDRTALPLLVRVLEEGLT
ncbi:MAG: HEAT repeat domain-containing protein, partial [Chloroflexi bacterium]|nr:HEAT repeat domain-containing protein [Chloroflexota bacterium]